jgi:hypothetical protein
MKILWICAAVLQIAALSAMVDQKKIEKSPDMAIDQSPQKLPTYVLDQVLKPHHPPVPGVTGRPELKLWMAKILRSGLLVMFDASGRGEVWDHNSNGAYRFIVRFNHNGGPVQYGDVFEYLDAEKNPMLMGLEEDCKNLCIMNEFHVDRLTLHEPSIVYQNKDGKLVGNDLKFEHWAILDPKKSDVARHQSMRLSGKGNPVVSYKDIGENMPEDAWYSSPRICDENDGSKFARQAELRFNFDLASVKKEQRAILMTDAKDVSKQYLRPITSYYLSDDTERLCCVHGYDGRVSLWRLRPLN